MPTYFSRGDGSYVPANVETRITLALYSTRLTPREISLRLGLSSDDAHKIGDRRGPRSPAFKTHRWSIGSGIDDAESVSEHLAALHSRIGAARDALRELIAADLVSAKVWVFHHVENWNPGMVLSHAEMAALAELGADLALDIYVYQPGELAPMRIPVRGPRRPDGPETPA
jgi:Domain of unknown function (DUF4279)